jgi:polysaccharide export outer membrane protein
MKAFFACILGCLILTVSHSIAAADDDFYLIGPGDVLEISVWNEPGLSKQLIIPPDGVISFPLINPIKVTNLTTTALKKVVTKRLSEYVPDATVTVMLIQINSLKASVIGKVKNAGEFKIDLKTSVLQILAKAGGLTPFASDSNIKILRQKNGKIINIPFDYGEVEKGKNLEQNIILKTGDVVLVP